MQKAKAMKWTLRAVVGASLLGTIPYVIGSSPMRVGKYDFSYMTNGDVRALPVQVFDNGERTYFQFRPGENVPVIFTHRNNALDLSIGKAEGPYVTIEDVAGRFVLQNGRSQANVVYGGEGRESVKLNVIAPSGVTSPVATAAAAKGRGTLVASVNGGPSGVGLDDMTANSYATPVKGDRVTWQESELRTKILGVNFEKGRYQLSKTEVQLLKASLKAVNDATRIVIIGRDDESYKEGLENARAKSIKDLLLSLSVDPAKIILKTGIHKETGNSKKWVSDIVLETVVPTQISRPDLQASSKAEYVRSQVQALVRAGALSQEAAAAILAKASPAQPVQQPTAAAGLPVAQAKPILDKPLEGFDFRAADKNVSTTIKRWASATSYEIVWDLPTAADAPVTGDGKLSAENMKEAMKKIADGMKAKGYPVAVTIYSNRVIRFAEAQSN